MKTPRFSCCCRLSELVARAREVAQARAVAATHRRAETAALLGLTLLLACAGYYH